MTAVRDLAVIQSAVQHKADGVILKPFTADMLKEKLGTSKIGILSYLFKLYYAYDIPLKGPSCK